MQSVETRPSVHGLARQSLGRPLTDIEHQLAQALEAIFASGVHDFQAVATELQARSIARPSGAMAPWTVADLESELVTINTALDAAYIARGIGA